MVPIAGLAPGMDWGSSGIFPGLLARPPWNRSGCGSGLPKPFGVYRDRSSWLTRTFRQHVAGSRSITINANDPGSTEPAFGCAPGVPHADSTTQSRGSNDVI
jgi:hypothetical protein